MNLKIDNSLSFQSKSGKLVPRYKKVLDKMAKEGKVTQVSAEASANIDNKMAIGMAKIKSDFRRRSIASWKAISSIFLD